MHVQKLKDMMLVINSAKKVKIPPNEVPNINRMSSNSSYVLYITANLRQSTRINKDNHRKEKEVKKAKTSLKKAIIDKENKGALKWVLDSILKKRWQYNISPP